MLTKENKPNKTKKIAFMPATPMKAPAFALMAFMALVPGQAYAAGGTNAISSMFSTVKDSVLGPIYYGLLGVIGFAAAIAIVVMLVKGTSDPRGEGRSKWFTGAVIVLGIVLLAAFLPMLINWVVGLGSNSHLSGIES